MTSENPYNSNTYPVDYNNMRNITYILTLVIISFSCVNKTNKQTENSAQIDSFDSKTDRFEKTDIELTQNIYKDTLSTCEFAQLILEDKIKPSDNEETFRCLEKLMSENEAEREFYFKVYRKISLQADGALSEVLGGYIKTFFELYPDFCISQYATFDTTEQNILIDNIAYEFYASGIDYQTDIDSYFNQINENLKLNSSNSKQTLIEIKSRVTNRVATISD